MGWEWVGLAATTVLGGMWLLMALYYGCGFDLIGRVGDWLDRRLG